MGETRRSSSVPTLSSTIWRLEDFSSSQLSRHPRVRVDLLALKARKIGLIFRLKFEFGDKEDAHSSATNRGEGCLHHLRRELRRWQRGRLLFGRHPQSSWLQCH